MRLLALALAAVLAAGGGWATSAATQRGVESEPKPTASQPAEMFTVYVPGWSNEEWPDDSIIALAAAEEAISIGSDGDFSTPTAATVAVWPDQLTEEQARAVLVAAGWPEEWIPSMLAIGWCESRYSPGAIGDHGASLGWLQLWTGWWAAAGEDLEQWDDPIVNARVALYIRTVRGRFGGSGGWTCAALEGIW